MTERIDNLMCRHENAHLMGTANGIVCRKCGKTFKDFSEVLADKAEPIQEPAPADETAEKPKRKRSKKAEVTL